MSKIIPLNEKLKLNAEQKAAALRKRKVRAVYKVFQCTQCASKCERCGAAVEHRANDATYRIPYHFCTGCAEEYTDYVRQLQGGSDNEAYWHNYQWMKVWETWIAYQGAVDQYLKSKEFRRLVEELGSSHHPCE